MIIILIVILKNSHCNKVSVGYSFFVFRSSQKFETPDFSFFNSITFVIHYFFRFSVTSKILDTYLFIFHRHHISDRFDLQTNISILNFADLYLCQTKTSKFWYACYLFIIHVLLFGKGIFLNKI